ncbi:DUF885 domain-containing protein [Ideonella sp. BN130291]|uniref:DUF885 domain-containing protein n=1 Tax=Ideonella sp. BN130291 TaxID=3112940 RepID=UPI002E26B5A3|nr:DUF885 domain-containing protein [Ideonella sp. BN130291]
MMRSHWSRLWMGGLLCLGLLGCGSMKAPGSGADEGQRLHALFEAEWEWGLQSRPEMATWVGDRRYADRLADVSEQATAARDAHARAWLAQLEAVKRDALSAEDQLSLDIALHQARDEVAGQAYPGLRTLTLSPVFGAHTLLAGLLRSSPAETEADLKAMLARLAAYPLRVDQEIARLQRGAAAGWRHSRPVVERVIEQIDVQLKSTAPAQSPFFEPFTRPGSVEVRQLRAQLAPQAAALISQQILPAQRKLRDYLVQQYLPGAPALGAMSGYPQGDAAYRYLVKSRTTTDLDPERIHAIGQERLAQLHAQMDNIRREVGFAGDFAGFVKHLNTDKRFFLTSEAALLAGYRDILKRIEPELPRVFAELPRAPMGVRAYPAFMGPDAAASYNGPTLDGSRAGWFNAATLGLATKPTWAMETLAAHEGVPGHHLQVARATELSKLPKFRRSGGYVAFNEGWALYAEVLAGDLGLYADPYSRFGHLQAQAFRAARLVVDTGLHAKGWSRRQAIDLIVEQTGMDRNQVTFEVDRYLAMPAQALGYMIGQLKIMELRDRAKRQLGERFDIRRFHNAVIDNGSLPLPVLERLIDAWIAKEMQR